MAARARPPARPRGRARHRAPNARPPRRRAVRRAGRSPRRRARRRPGRPLRSSTRPIGGCSNSPTSTASARPRSPLSWVSRSPRSAAGSTRRSVHLAPSSEASADEQPRPPDRDGSTDLGARPRCARSARGRGGRASDRRLGGLQASDGGGARGGCCARARHGRERTAARAPRADPDGGAATRFRDESRR